MTVFKTLVAASYDAQAERYVRSSDMQSGNLSRLLELADPFLRRSDAQTVLDLGCGAGAAIPHLAARGLFSMESYLGIDLSSAMIVLARRRFQDDKHSFLRGEAEALPAADESIDIVLSNSVLHWLNQPKLGSTPAKAFKEIARCLRRGGVLAASIAGVGTGRRFLEAYRESMNTIRQNRGEFNEAMFLANPVGCMNLHEVVDTAAREGLEVVLAELDYEPVRFSSAHAYCEAVRAYGYSAFMAALPAERQPEGWESVCRAFLVAVGDGPYVHDQYMCYLVAMKP